jgi:hypothetical protein
VREVQDLGAAIVVEVPYQEAATCDPAPVRHARTWRRPRGDGFSLHAD